MFKNALEQFRVMGFLEGSSLLILLFIAMPLKYGFDLPQAVSIVGAIHGGLFTLYCAAIVYATFVVKWPFRFAIGAVIVAFIPFGNFVLDNRLKNWQKAQAA